jgi:hypothetical protein
VTLALVQGDAFSGGQQQVSATCGHQKIFLLTPDPLWLTAANDNSPRNSASNRPRPASLCLRGNGGSATSAIL